MYYAIQVYANGTKVFFHAETETIEQMEKAIAEWKSRVTPRMAETTKFEIAHD